MLGADPAGTGSTHEIRAEALVVPGQILSACFAKINLYGFLVVQGRFPELLRILENDGATGAGCVAGGVPDS